MCPTTPTDRRSFDVVVAACRKTLGIGVEGRLPWRLPLDMRYFKQLTTSTRDPLKRNAVVMGRKTWASIPSKFRPLADRVNIVLSRSPEAEVRAAHDLPDGVFVASSLESALALLSGPEHCAEVETIYVIGGAAVYAEALASPRLERAHITLVDLPEGEPAPAFDALLPAGALDGLVREPVAGGAGTHEHGGTRFEFAVYVRADAVALPPRPPPARRAHGEYQYLDLVADVLARGTVRGDRTGTGTLSVFGAQMRFDLRHSFPLLTTKSVFWRGVAEELLWFVSGDTSADTLRAKGVRIWDGNSSREYLDSIGLAQREAGDLGPVYGFQWRHFGAEYADRHAPYAGQGVDQLARAIELLRTRPHDRRILVCAWNPPDLPKMALPPCHVLFQFYVNAHGELSCQMYQRSADLGLGVPFNIASYALLTRIVAHVTGLKPGELVHTIGDAHVYCNHVDALKQQLMREPMPFPTLTIDGADGVTDIDAIRMEHLTLHNYKHHAKLPMKMAV